MLATASERSPCCDDPSNTPRKGGAVLSPEGKQPSAYRCRMGVFPSPPARPRREARSPAFAARVVQPKKDDHHPQELACAGEEVSVIVPAMTTIAVTVRTHVFKRVLLRQKPGPAE